MWWFQRGVCALPAALVTWSLATFVVSYVTAVLLGHVDLLVPYISDASAVVPERCVFGFMLSISSFLGVATVYVRYKQVQALALGGELKLHRLNCAGMVLGIMSSVGMCVVANFQKTTIVSVHLLGAGLTFGCGTLYILVQTGVSYHMQPRFHGRDILWARTAVGLWTMASVIISFVSSAILYDDLPGVDVDRKIRWRPEETGYTAHLVSAVAEWCLAFSFICFFLTYIRDFQVVFLLSPMAKQNKHYNCKTSFSDLFCITNYICMSRAECDTFNMLQLILSCFIS
ncbi:DNA damage-regulated autophagy modulator protein 2 isoform X1 [Oncorhynchus mykiss]|nr:DNA damage-regulated autophagy modulator protein 2 isoform X1 [Oncorhynchus mykiss]XP_036844028.1 DNA damage-regulated autophagy modulator protein 2 isoform X1 [Oncorhynchus mykiss]